MIDPEVLEKMSKNRLVKRLLKELLTAMTSFDSVDGIESTDPTEIAIEIKARKLAFNKLKDVLKPLLNANETKIKFNNKEYLA